MNVRLQIGWFLAELLGTALLALVAVTATVGNAGGYLGYGALFVPFAVGLTLMVLVMALGSITGAHCNPAVTIGQALFRHVSATQCWIYLVAQFIGGWLGVHAARLLLVTPAAVPPPPTTGIVTGEFLGAIILTTVVMLVTLKRISAVMAGPAIGGALAIALTAVSVAGAGILNPAIAFGLAGYRLTYLGVPLLAGITGAALAIIFDETVPMIGEKAN